MMHQKITLDESTPKILYAQYKSFLIPIGIIASCILLFFVIIIPQITELFSTDKEIKVLREKIAVLKENIRFLSTVPTDVQDKNVTVATAALPPEKDYAGIIRAISIASVKSGAEIDDFSFSVGNIADESKDANSNPAINLELNIQGSMDVERRFLEQLYQTTPLSEIKNLEINADVGTLSILFYYKAVPQVKVDYEKPIAPLSKSETALLDTISLW